MSIKPSNVKALETGSGIGWDEWVRFLEPHRTLPHAEMAEVVLAKILEAGRSSSPQWWAQGVTVAFEQHIGRRLPGQRADGTFSISVSRTIPGDVDQALDHWVALVGTRTEFDGVPIAGEPRISRTDTWRYWRCELSDGSSVAVNIRAKPSGASSTLSINHDKLTEPDAVERVRAYWKAFGTR